MAARFERDEHLRAGRIGTTVYRRDFRVRSAKSLMKSFADCFSIPHDYGPDHGVRFNVAATALRNCAYCALVTSYLPILNS